MKFYSIRNSLNNLVVGNYNQVVNAHHNCDVWKDSKFIDKIDFVKISFEPVTSNAILEKKAKLTDLINASCIGFGLRLLISDKLKKILDKRLIDNCQFFNAPVIFKNEMIDNYWISHPYMFSMELIDFSKCIISVREKKLGGGTDKKLLIINSLSEFTKILNFYKEKEEIVSINNIKLYDNTDDHFFIIRYVEGGIAYIVSEELKKEIENTGCTGIEFQPVELTYDEWTAPAGERERTYGKV